MRKKTVFIFLTFLTILASCKKEDFSYENEFERSFSTWENFKARTGNSYTYVVNSSSWIGLAWQTEITVSNGEVSQRSYKLLSNQGLNNIPESEKEWVEIKSEINSHTTGAAPLTLDQIYEKARTEWLVKRENATAYFEAENGGLISKCGYVDDGCQDDCFIGVQISSIK